MTGYFWIEGLCPRELFAALAAEGIHAPELLTAEAVGVAVLCMGWNWAVWIAQNLLEEILVCDGVPDFSHENSLKHAHPPPVFHPGEPGTETAHLEYIDDYAAVVLQPFSSSEAQRIQDAAGHALRSAGLDVHKLQLGAVVDFLGFDVLLHLRLILPKKSDSCGVLSKFSLVVLATRYVSWLRRASPHQVEVLLGHWTHYALLQRLLFSILQRVYAFVRGIPPEREVDLPKDVIEELNVLVALAPLVRADLALDWCRTVSMVDAGPSLGAVVYAEMPVEAVACEGRHGLVSGWLYAPSDSPAAASSAEPGVSHAKVRVPPQPVPDDWVTGGRWRLGAVSKWLQREHNNISEGRCVVLAVQRLTRTRSGRRCKMLVVTDSQVVLGVFRKGRTSSPGLLYLARRLAALCMGYQVRLSLRYVPSAKNLADGPSRGMRTPGVAPETLLKTSSGRSARTQRFDDNCGFPGEGPSTGKTSSGRSARTQRFDSTLGYPGEGPPKGGRRKTPPPPLKNRGRFVWEQVAHTGLPPGRAAGGVNFLHVHAVSDGTLVNAYLPAVTEFLQQARWRRWPLDTTPQRDAALADMLAILCYEWDVGIQRGRNLFHGFLHAYPEHTDLLPEAYRALQSWERLGTEQEGQPICIEAWACIVIALLRQGVEEAALITGLSYDCLLRGQDWQGLRLRHVFDSCNSSGTRSVALFFGDRTLGESVKTGSDQGVIVERSWLANWLLDFCQRRTAVGAEYVFSLSGADFRALFAAAQRLLGIPYHPPHCLRHGGAAELLEGRPDLIHVVKRRGRWQGDKSLKRYSKTHVLVMHRASLPEAVLSLGRLFLKNPELELARARENSLAPR